MIDITEINLIEFAKKVYELSVPQGRGFLHYTSQPLAGIEAKLLVDIFKDDKTLALDMDYIKGRACKMQVFRQKPDKLKISDTWYGHTDRIYQQLLDHFNIQKHADKEHSCACACIDCQSKRGR